MPAHFQLERTLHRVRALTLDLDDTLWPIDPVIHRAEVALWNWLSDNYPRIPETFSADKVLELRQSVVDEYWHQSHDFRFLRKKVLERVAIESGYDTDLVDPAFSVFDDARNAVELYTEVIPALEELRRRFIIVAVTNGNANLQAIGIRHFFSEVVTAAETGSAKPDQRIFDVAVECTGVGRDEILHVGDHPETDVVGARQAGLKTAWMNRSGSEWPSQFESPDAVINNFDELIALLDVGERKGAR